MRGTTRRGREGQRGRYRDLDENAANNLANGEPSGSHMERDLRRYKALLTTYNNKTPEEVEEILDEVTPPPPHRHVVRLEIYSLVGTEVEPGHIQREITYWRRLVAKRRPEQVASSSSSRRGREGGGSDCLCL